MVRYAKNIALAIIACICSWLGGISISAMAASSPSLPCEKPGWFPEDYGLKDHTVFWYEGYYYIAANYIPGEKKFAYARSMDLCVWEEFAPILAEFNAGEWDEAAVWAPYVFEEGGTFYLVYTGVTNDFTQSIMLATSINPADPQSWQRRGMIFQPDHAGSNWEAGSWADCRDPFLLKMDDTYYLYYTAADLNGGIIGLATAGSLDGEWFDWGSIITTEAGNLPESPNLYQYLGNTYLFYHLPSQPETYRIGPSPTGPWLDPEVIAPGWAHEAWNGADGQSYISYLTDYSVTISPLTWIPNTIPARPFIGAGYYRTLVPLVAK